MKKYKLINKEEFDKETDEIFTILSQVDDRLSDHVHGDELEPDDEKITLPILEAYDLERNVADAVERVELLRNKYLNYC